MLKEGDRRSGTHNFDRWIDFQQFLHSPVLVKLYRPRDGAKEYPGTLEGYDNGRVTIATGSGSLTFEKSEIAQVRLRVEF